MLGIAGLSFENLAQRIDRPSDQGLVVALQPTLPVPELLLTAPAGPASSTMDKYIVYSKDLTKADTLILKNLDADIKDVLSKPASSSGANGARQTGKLPHSPWMRP